MQSTSRALKDSKALAGHREWIASREALRLVTEAYALHDIVEYESKERQQRAAMALAADAILRRLAEGALLAKPIWFRFVQGSSEGAAEHAFHLREQDRTIDPNFWRTLRRLQPVATIDWIAGDFIFDDSDAGIYAKGHASGVKFDLANLPALDRLTPKPASKAGGAPRKWDWDGALIYLAALAHQSPDGLLRHNGNDPNQSDIARYLRSWFVDTVDDAPENSQLREYGKRFVAELTAMKLRAANNSSRSE